jgi:cytochrome d ubiquinol oxidase subunit I
MDLDPVLLSRLQFFWVIALHILLPAFTVGLASFIAVLEGLHVFTRRQVYLQLSQYWIKIFAVSFGLGVVSGIVMPFQFGTNWSRLSDSAGDIIGPLLAYEGLTAFFLESAFLGVLLFGRKLVPPWAHFASAVVVAAGTLFSSFWILATNSWMQTPTGYEVVDGRFLPADWTQVIFNPSFPYRLSHTVVAFFTTSAFVVLGAAAYHLRRGRFIDEGRTMMSMTLWLVSVLVPLQIVLGDLHGLNTIAHQPAKIAAMEGLWSTTARAPAVLFAIPDESAEANRFEIAIPALASLYLRHDLDGVVQGLHEWPQADRPPVAVVFFAFRIMVGVGLLLLAIVALGGWLRWRGRLFTSPWFLALCQYAGPLGFVAVIAGWVTTEAGRQPWVVYGLMRTRDAVSPTLSGGDVALSLALYVVVYLLVYGGGLRIMLRLIKAGPAPQPVTGPQGAARPARPLSAAGDGVEGVP